jgi:hypothetical protein
METEPRRIQHTVKSLHTIPGKLPKVKKNVEEANGIASREQCMGITRNDNLSYKSTQQKSIPAILNLEFKS